MMNEEQSKKYAPEVALEKIKKYCAYQERAQQEVRNKLYSYGLFSIQVENIISTIINDGFLNEERFAIAYARGKCRIVKWGKNKIKSELRKKNISDYCIRKALNEIDADEYLSILQNVVLKKDKEVKEKNQLKRKYKIAQYAISRGFEQNLVWDFIEAREE